MKVYKNKNPNKFRIGALFILQVIFGSLPAFLFIIFAIDSMKFAEAKTEEDRQTEDIKMEITRLEMRLAALAARLSAPKKGDRPDQLQAEYLLLAEQLRILKTPQGR